MIETTKQEIERRFNEQQEYFRSGKTLGYQARKSLLKTLKAAIKKHESKLIEALNKDLGKSEFEAYSNEIGILYKEINHSLKHLRRSMRPRNITPDLHLLPGSARIQKEPYGVTLIIAPWNYPVQLQLSPLIGAFAAGNTAILKPSELSSATAQSLTDMVKDCFDPKALCVINGGIETTSSLLGLPVDYIFFTGSVPVGKIVMKAASKRLTPITLELGGKSPVFVTPSAKLDTAAKRIAWGKYNNTGQTCVAPDYALVHRSVYDEFVDKLKKTVALFYGTNPLQSPDYGRIINQRHFDRLAEMMTPELALFGGERDRESLFIAPTAYGPVDWSHPLMADEIFGPLLPILIYDDLDQAIKEVPNRPKPLALYVFSQDKQEIKKIDRSISFGGGGINCTVLHVASTKLPFGGVGSSGMGHYHGESSFQVFSHTKSMLKQPTLLDLGLAYPHKRISLKMVKRVLR
ncbi:MAG: aldehyde dehydrogenase [Spirochaetaceae bacterium]|nr:aldehyde dehydrogenase [Spirochaetaceae bacterium]